MILTPPRSHTGRNGFPGVLLVALLLLGSVVLGLAAAHAMCATSDAAMSGTTATSAGHAGAMPHVAGVHVESDTGGTPVPTHQMQGLVDCVMAGIAGLLVALLLIGLLHIRHDPRSRPSQDRAQRAPPLRPRPDPSRSLTVLCVSRT
jgi:hypothetical protein